MRTELLCISVLRVASGPRVKLASCKRILNSLLLCGHSRRRFVLSVALGYFVLVFFCPFSIAITPLREERDNLCAFRTFV